MASAKMSSLVEVRCDGGYCSAWLIDDAMGWPLAIAELNLIEEGEWWVARVEAGGIMKIFVVIDGENRKYVHAKNLKEAKRGHPRGSEVRPWNKCMWPRHDEIPGTAPGWDAEHLIDGVPICDLCYKQITMTVEERLDRLEQWVVALRYDFNFHEDHHD